MRSRIPIKKRLVLGAALATAVATTLTTLGPVAPAMAAGTLDPTFTGAGRVVVPGDGYRFGDLDSLPDDRFVTVGIRNNAARDQVDVRRYLANGALDPSFAGVGAVSVGGPRGTWNRPSVVVEPVTGSTYATAWSPELGVSRVWKLTAAGALDTTWNGTGVSGYAGSQFTDLDISARGQLLAVRDSTIYRFDSFGGVDAAFGSGGGATLPVTIDSIEVLPDGDIVAAGHGGDTLDAFRLSNSGRLRDFGTNGRGYYRMTPPLGFAIAGMSPASVGVQNDGSVVVAGNVIERNLGNGNQRSALVVVRFTKGGAVDNRFAVHRDYPLNLSGTIAIQANDKILLPAMANDHAAVVRLDRDGTLDPSWGVGGNFVDAAKGSRATAIEVQRPGRVVAVGLTLDTNGLLWGLSGDLTPSCKGKLATAYGDNGKNTFLGSDQQDVIVASGGADTVKTYRGDDKVCAGGGKDRVETGSGDDKVLADNGKDKVYAGSGKDKVKGSGGDDRLYGGSGKDKIKGGPGDDWLYGGADRDKLSGGPGRDHIRH